MTDHYSTDAPPHNHSGSSVVKLVIAWLIVTLPAVWGVAQTVQKSLPLFESTSAANTTAPAQTPTTAPPSPELQPPAAPR